jgi:hypothetical protein
METEMMSVMKSKFSLSAGLLPSANIKTETTARPSGDPLS